MVSKGEREGGLEEVWREIQEKENFGECSIRGEKKAGEKEKTRKSNGVSLGVAPDFFQDKVGSHGGRQGIEAGEMQSRESWFMN